jgi:hypothetical protein
MFPKLRIIAAIGIPAEILIVVFTWLTAVKECTFCDCYGKTQNEPDNAGGLRAPAPT